MDNLGEGLAVCGLCFLVAAELYFKAPDWAIGWTIFAIFWTLI